MLQQFIRRTIQDLTRPLFLKQMAWVITFWIVTVITIQFNIDFLQTTYPDAARPDDRVLHLIPETRAFITIGEVLSAVQVVLIVYIMWQWRFKPAPKLLFLVALMFMIRGFTITLTPLAQIQPPSENYAESHIIAQTFYHGMFFSGHTASAFIQAFYVRGHRLRPLVFALATLQAFALLASHSHYTIDVFGGFFVAYFVTHYDFMRLVPSRFRQVKWLPWYDAEREAAHEHLQTLLAHPPIPEREPQADKHPTLHH